MEIETRFYLEGIDDCPVVNENNYVYLFEKKNPYIKQKFEKLVNCVLIWGETLRLDRYQCRPKSYLVVDEADAIIRRRKITGRE